MHVVLILLLKFVYNTLRITLKNFLIYGNRLLIDGGYAADIDLEFRK